MLRVAKRKRQKSGDCQSSKLTKKAKRTPVLEPTRNSLALMQTAVMSFARSPYLGKADLPN